LEGDKEILAYKNGLLTITKEIELKIEDGKGIIVYQGRRIGNFELKLDDILQTQPIILKQNLRSIL